MTFSVQNITIWSNFFWCSGSFSYGYKFFPRNKQTSPENPSLALLPQIVRHKGTLYCGWCIHDIMLLNSVGRIPWPCFSIDEYTILSLFSFSVVVHDIIQAAVIASFFPDLCFSDMKLTDIEEL